MQEAFAFSTDELRRLPNSGSPCRFAAEASHPTSFLAGPSYACDYNYCYACDSCKCCAGSPQHSNSSSTPQQQTSTSPTPFVSAPSSPRQIGGSHFYNREDDLAHNYRSCYSESPQQRTPSAPQRFIADGNAASAAERDLYICRENRAVGSAAAGNDDEKKKEHQQRRSHGDEQSCMDIVVDFENSEFEFHASGAGRNREFADGTMASVDFDNNPSIMMMSPAPMLSSLGNHLFCCNNNSGGRISAFATAAAGDEFGDYCCCTPAAATDRRLRPLIPPPLMSPIHASSTNHSRSTTTNHATSNYCAHHVVDDRLLSDSLQMQRKPPHPCPSEVAPVPASNRFPRGEVRDPYGSGDGVGTSSAGGTPRNPSPGHRNSEPGVTAASRNVGDAKTLTVKVEGQQRKPCSCSSSNRNCSLSSSSAAAAPPPAAVSSSSSSTSPRFSAALRACISGCPSTTLGGHCGGGGGGGGGSSPAAMSTSTAAASSKSLHHKSRRPPPTISSALRNRSRCPPPAISSTFRNKSTTTRTTTTGRWPAALCASTALDAVLDAALHTAARCVPSGSESPTPPPVTVAVAPERFLSSVSNPSSTGTSSARTRSSSHRRTTGRNFESIFVGGRRRSDPPAALSSNSTQIQAQPETDTDSTQQMQFMGGRTFCRDGDPQRKRLTLGELLHVRQ